MPYAEMYMDRSKDLIGPDAAAQVQSIIANVEIKDQGLWGTIIGGVVLIITATGVFTEIQGSINYMWGIKAKPKKGLLKLIVNRLISFSSRSEYWIYPAWFHCC
jgi:membrane protein